MWCRRLTAPAHKSFRPTRTTSATPRCRPPRAQGRVLGLAHVRPAAARRRSATGDLARPSRGSSGSAQADQHHRSAAEPSPTSSRRTPVQRSEPRNTINAWGSDRQGELRAGTSGKPPGGHVAVPQPRLRRCGAAMAGLPGDGEHRVGAVAGRRCRDLCRVRRGSRRAVWRAGRGAGGAIPGGG